MAKPEKRPHSVSRLGMAVASRRLPASVANAMLSARLDSGMASGSFRHARRRAKLSTSGFVRPFLHFDAPHGRLLKSQEKSFALHRAQTSWRFGFCLRYEFLNTSKFLRADGLEGFGVPQSRCIV